MTAGSPKKYHWWWVVFFLGGIWMLLFWSLAAHWSVTQQYAYGWIAPVLILYSFVTRWQTRPPPGKGLSVGLWIAGAAVLTFFPIWLILQPSPDWRMLSWIQAAQTIGITLGIAAFIGGGPWVRHFSFPAMLVFAAVPWPRPIEIPFIDGLTHAVTRAGVELLNLFGIHAVQHGQVIETQAGLLGVENACSGIQSLQATLMASLFFGEMYGLTKTRRLLLAVTGIMVALVTNVARTCFLAFKAALSGIASVEEWHDLAANIALVTCFTIVWAIAVGQRRERAHAPASRADLDHLPAPAVRYLAALTAWILGTLAFAELWFYDPQTNAADQWTIAPPPYANPLAIPKLTAEELQADETKSALWKDERGRRWQLYFFRWKPGPTRSRLLARLHQPDRCLPATGLTLVQDRGRVTIPGAIPLEFRAFRFDQGGSPLFVYSGVWENRSNRGRQQGQLSESLTKAAFQMVLWRERNLGQQVVEIAVSGLSHSTDADAELQRILPSLIVPGLPSNRP